jgi:hypothetical protein
VGRETRGLPNGVELTTVSTATVDCVTKYLFKKLSVDDFPVEPYISNHLPRDVRH